MGTLGRRTSGWTYLAALAYVSGCDAATNYRLLDGFEEWLGEPSIAWWSTIASKRFPGLREDGRRYSNLTDNENAALIGDLFDVLARFLDEKRAVRLAWASIRE